MSELLLRSAGARVFERGQQLFVVDPKGVVRRLDGGSAALAREVLALLEHERTRDELFASLEELIGGPVEPASVVDELLSLLRQCGAVHAVARSAPSVSRPSRRGLRLVLGVTGAVQTIHTPWLVSLLLAEGHDVRVAMTENALRFCREEGLEALTHNPVCKGLWSEGTLTVAPHIRWAEWADLVVIAPASASTVARIASGSCEDIVSAIAIATRAPVVVAPSMNAAMADAPSHKRNLRTLCEDGFIVVHPSVGHEVALAPSERHAMRGTMPSPPEFVAMLRAILGTHPARREPNASALGASWNERYLAPADARPWESASLDEGFRPWIDRVAQERPAARALDLGCGTGTVALALSAAGMDVSALDLAGQALSLARARPGAERVTWIEGDVLSATIAGRFDFVCDRALLHVLSPAQHRLYAQRVSSWLAPGGVLVLTAHSEQAPSELGTVRMSTRMVAELFDGLLAIESVERCAMKGPAGSEVPARRYVLRAG